MKYRLDFPGLAFVKLEPDPANPGAILTAAADGTRPRSFVFSLDECGKLARALAEYVPAEEPGVRPCPVCDHDQRYTDEMIRALRKTKAFLIAKALDASAERLIRQIDAALGIEP